MTPAAVAQACDISLFACDGRYFDGLVLPFELEWAIKWKMQ